MAQDLEFGPAMGRLSQREQFFVILFFENGGNQIKALDEAGFVAKNRHSLERLANYYIHKPAVMEAIKEENARRNVLLVPKIQAAISNLIDNPQAKDHFKALKMASDNAGVTRAVERVLSVNVTVSREDKLRELAEFAKSHGGTVLGIPIETITGETTDAEYEELPAPDPVRDVKLEDLI